MPPRGNGKSKPKGLAKAKSAHSKAITDAPTESGLAIQPIGTVDESPSKAVRAKRSKSTAEKLARIYTTKLKDWGKHELAAAQGATTSMTVEEYLVQGNKCNPRVSHTR
jgi:hypothetical protein